MCLKNVNPSLPNLWILYIVVYYQHLKNLEQNKSISLVMFLNTEFPLWSVTMVTVPLQYRFSCRTVSCPIPCAVSLVISITVLMICSSTDHYWPPPEDHWGRPAVTLRRLHYKRHPMLEIISDLDFWRRSLSKNSVKGRIPRSIRGTMHKLAHSKNHGEEG